MDELYHLFLDNTIIAEVAAQDKQLLRSASEPDGPTDEGCIEGYCLAPDSGKDGSFFFVFASQVYGEPEMLWRGPRRKTPVDFHEGLRALCLAAATPRLPCEVGEIARLCFYGATGAPPALKRLFAYGLDTEQYDAWLWGITPTARTLDLFHIPHNLGPSLPRTKRR